MAVAMQTDHLIRRQRLMSGLMRLDRRKPRCPGVTVAAVLVVKHDVTVGAATNLMDPDKGVIVRQQNGAGRQHAQAGARRAFGERQDWTSRAEVWRFRQHWSEKKATRRQELLCMPL